MDIKEIRALLRMFELSSIHELEVDSGDNRVRMVRTAPHAAVNMSAATYPVAPVATAAAAPVHAATPTASSPSDDADLVRAPIVGTFFRAPSPGAPPFVEIGAVVKPGQILCIVEAMKMMNEIEADRAGRVTEILVDNGQPVEFDHPLFRIAAA